MTTCTDRRTEVFRTATARARATRVGVRVDNRDFTAREWSVMSALLELSLGNRAEAKTVTVEAIAEEAGADELTTAAALGLFRRADLAAVFAITGEGLVARVRLDTLDDPPLTIAADVHPRRQRRPRPKRRSRPTTAYRS